MAEGLDPITGYQTSDTDTSSASPQYFGFIQPGPSTSWYILQSVTTSGIQTYRYFFGSGLTNYQTNWTNRAGLAYDYYSAVFKNS